MKVKPRMCQCKQCKSSKKFRVWQREYFSKYFRRISKQKMKNWDFEMLNFTKIIDYYTD